MNVRRVWASGRCTTIDSDDDALEIEGLDIISSDPADSKGITCEVHAPSKYLGETVIETNDIFKVFDLPGSKSQKIKAFESVSLRTDSRTKQIRAGEFVMIRGPSGGG